MYQINAACICNTGKVRSNNEDNFFFDGKILEEDNHGLTKPLQAFIDRKHPAFFAVFDGMGGENYGEAASYAAAHALQKIAKKFPRFLFNMQQYLESTVQKINRQVVLAAEQRNTKRMGSTMAAILIRKQQIVVCNLGDSRVFLFRDDVLQQISVDHVSSAPVFSNRKPALTQHLGIDPTTMRIEPYVAQLAIQQNDRYLLCSDGITDMLTGQEIEDIIKANPIPTDCVSKLELAALEHGGRDNLTAIICKVTVGGEENDRYGKN